MELIRGLHNVNSSHGPCAVAIGNFDGVHLGHQAVISHLAEQAERLKVPSLVMLFEPQPAEYFNPAGAPARLTRLREKLIALAAQAVDRVLCVRFDENFASLTPDDFIHQVLLKDLAVRYVVVGKDFRFGNKRMGDVAHLKQVGREFGFEVSAAPTFVIDEERVSSTRIRGLLARGDLTGAAKLLGRPYSICGRVAHGNKIGRQIGIPTANIHLHRNRTALDGIFVAEMITSEGERLPAVVSIGIRPTIGGNVRLLEVHLLDFNGNIYGHHVEVRFLQKLREERRFDSLDEMRVHILRDIETAKRYFNNGRDSSSASASGV